MRILVINGSPHKKGNTFLTVESFLSGFKKEEDKVQTYHLSTLNYSTCIDCKKCYDTGHCIFKDDLNPLYKDYDQADFTIISSPIYFFTVSAYLKAAIDRTQAFWASKYILKKPTINRYKKRNGVFIATAGATKSKNHPEALTPVLDMYFKAVNTKLLEEITYFGTDKIKMEDRPNDLNDVKSRGREIRENLEKS